MLTAQQGQALVALARQQIEQHLGIPAGTDISAFSRVLGESVFQQRRGVFVTLHKSGNLRGCIGSLAASEPLIEGIKSHALNAAFQDYRFPPLTAAELPELHVEISILTEPQPLACTGPDDLVRQLRPGIDGVILRGTRGEQATFLPQVWQQLPGAEQFLSQLCRKAGLPDMAWRSEPAHISTYQVQSFEEPR